MPADLPSSGFLTAHAGILAFLVVVIGFLVVNLIVWSILRPSRFSEEKLTTYECGENPTGSAWVQFNIRFYVFALIFIIFDVEAVFLLPVGGGLPRARGMLAFVEGLVFIAILVVALAYVWRKGDLEWVRAEDRSIGMTEITGPIQNKFSRDEPRLHHRGQRGQLGAQVQPLADDLRPRLLRHRDDGHRGQPLRLGPLRHDPARHAPAERPHDRGRHRHPEDGHPA